MDYLWEYNQYLLADRKNSAWLDSDLRDGKCNGIDSVISMKVEALEVLLACTDEVKEQDRLKK